MRLAVGCPVAHRSWILPMWFEYIERSCKHAGVEPEYVFVCDRRDPCWELIEGLAPTARLVSCVTTKGDDDRRWNPKRYEQMASLRNSLLYEVRTMAPDAFLSLDSDILAHPELVERLLDDLDLFDAVGGRCYMTTTTCKYPSYAMLSRSGGLMRVDTPARFPVDVIMAIKMMGPLAYRVPYRSDSQGEDIGWSKACRERGVRLGWDGAVISKHVMGPHMLGGVDGRVGF